MRIKVSSIRDFSVGFFFKNLETLPFIYMECTEMLFSNTKLKLFKSYKWGTTDI